MIGIIIFMIGIPSSLSQGAVEGLNLLPDTDFLSSIDFITGSIMLPLSGFIIALFVGWGWRKTELFEQSDFGQTGLGMALLWLLRVVVPIAVFLVFPAIGPLNHAGGHHVRGRLGLTQNHMAYLPM